jgi:hypothetical protein
VRSGGDGRSDEFATDPRAARKNDVLRILGTGVGAPIVIYAIGVLAVIVILIRELRRGDDE